MNFPTSPYWPMAQGSWAEYAAYTITGYFHPDTGELDTWTPAHLPANDCRMTYVAIDDGLVPKVARVMTGIGVAPPNTWRDTCNSLIESPGFAAGGGGYIGESGTYANYGTPPQNSTAFIQQPEPQLPLNDTDYLTAVDGLSIVNNYDKGTGRIIGSENMQWRFRNLGKGTGPGSTFWWPQYPNQLRTMLIERPDTFVNENVYNYLFAQGVGLLMEWTISRRRDNTGSGWMRQIIRCSP